jgi:hypothetical protein
LFPKKQSERLATNVKALFNPATHRAEVATQPARTDVQAVVSGSRFRRFRQSFRLKDSYEVEPMGAVYKRQGGFLFADGLRAARANRGPGRL